MYLDNFIYKCVQDVWNMWSHYADTPRDTCFLLYFVKCFSQKSERKIPNLRNGIFLYISRKHFHMIVMQSVA